MYPEIGLIYLGIGLIYLGIGLIYPGIGLIYLGIRLMQLIYSRIGVLISGNPKIWYILSKYMDFIM